ncbi:MAG: hypothetical protein WEC34_15205 [Acidimicrobiia bacterium]
MSARDEHPTATHRDAEEPVDELPADLDVTAFVGPEVFPDIRRRRIAGAILAVLGLASLLGGVNASNSGLVAAGVLLLLLALYHVAAAWPLRIDETEALAAASRTVGFPVGHASAQLGWRGLRSRPSWRILLYSADAPPTRRGLVELDAVDGEVLGEYVEQNPEDWSQYGLDDATPTPPVPRAAPPASSSAT